MPVPTDDDLREYAKRLPDIYRQVLAAFPQLEPERRHGDALDENTIAESVLSNNPARRFDDVTEALRRLIDRGFLERGGVLNMVWPTALGERLITVVTGHVAAPAGIPELPVPTWG